MLKKIIFTSDPASPNEAHCGGGCSLPNTIAWPKNKNGENLLHILTIPTGWVIEKSEGWISIFTPFNLKDTYLHWEELTPDGKNQSTILFHDNDGDYRNEYTQEISPSRKILLHKINDSDSDKNFASKIYGIPAWLQDEDSVSGHQCHLALNGEDIDIGFQEEPGIFSDGMVYIFLKNNFQLQERPSSQGMITFQFT